MFTRRQRVSGVRYALVIFLCITLVLFTATKFRHDIERGLDINEKINKLQNLTLYTCLEDTFGDGAVEDLLSMVRVYSLMTDVVSYRMCLLALPGRPITSLVEVNADLPVFKVL